MELAIVLPVGSYEPSVKMKIVDAVCYGVICDWTEEPNVALAFEGFSVAFFLVTASCRLRRGIAWFQFKNCLGYCQFYFSPASPLWVACTLCHFRTHFFQPAGFDRGRTLLIIFAALVNMERWLTRGSCTSFKFSYCFILGERVTLQ